jgi:hypothetical protein
MQNSIHRRAARIASMCLVLATGAVASAQMPATLADYWAGNAKWDFVAKRNFNDPSWQLDSSTVTVVGNDWYLFFRTVTKNDSCPGGVQLGTQVRKSSNRGGSWTASVTALAPVPGTAWACAATDGDAFYDAVNSKWRYLYQCLGADNVWRGCYAERAGSDPLGPFTPVAQNPVIQPKALWSQICNASTDDCVAQASGTINNVHDEGTFNIFRFDGTHFWLSFHGYDGTRGYRGIAKTANFLTYCAGGSTCGSGEATPSDAIIDKNDASSWREAWQGTGAIGAGHGQIILDGGYYYGLTEIADVNLACTAGQNWDFGLFRSNSLSSTTWQQFPLGNPVIYSSRQAESGSASLPCNLQYAQIFKDSATGYFYLKYYRQSTDWSYHGTYFYRLVKASNLLRNADLWMGDGSYWSRIPTSPTNIAVYRYPNLSPDGTPVLAANCGTASCNVGQSIYQDVDVTAYRGRSYTFGGQFSTTGGSGTLSLAVFQLDASFNVLQSNSVAISATGGSYTAALSTNFVISSGAKYLRYQFYMESPSVTYLADNMFLNLN